jgi:hypothetical protein
MTGSTHLAVRRLAGVVLVAACLATPAGAQQPEPYSLVTARQKEFRPPSPSSCIWLEDRFHELHSVCQEGNAVWYDEARSLAGSPVESDFGASTHLPDDAAGWYRPVLLIVARVSVPTVIAQATADKSGRACLAREPFDRLGWHPSGPGIAVEADRLCVSLADLAALPIPPMPEGKELTAKQIRHWRRRHR